MNFGQLTVSESSAKDQFRTYGYTLSDTVVSYMVPSSQPVPTISDPHAPVGSFLRRDVLLHPFVEKDTVTVDGQERERVIIRMLPSYMTNPYVHKFVMYMVAAAAGCTYDSFYIQPFAAPSLSALNESSIKSSRDGRTLFVGDHGATVGGFTVAGTVQVWQYNVVDELDLIQTIAPSDPRATGRFGYSIDISADDSTLVIGSPGLNVNNPQGYIYVYTKNNGAWAFHSKLPNVSGADLGTSVACNYNGSVICAGDPLYSSDGVSNCGAVFVFQKSGSAYSLVHTLFATVKSTNLQFGSNIAMSDDGEYLITGTSIIGPTASAYITVFNYYASPTTVKITPPVGSTRWRFGHQVTITANGYYAVVSEPVRPSPDIRGEVHVYSIASNGDASFISTLIAPDAINDTDNFGTTVSISALGDVLFVGARSADIGSSTVTGKVYVFNSSNSWSTISNQIFESPTPLAPLVGGNFGAIVTSSYKGCKFYVEEYGTGKIYAYSCPCDDQPENYLITYYRQTYDNTVNQYHDFIVNNQNYDVRFFGQATTRTVVSSDCFVYYWQTQTGAELGTTGFFSMELWIGDLSDSGVGIWSGFSASSRTFTNSSTVSNYLNNNDVSIFIEAIHSTDTSKSLTFLYVHQKNDYTTSPDIFINIIGNAVYTIV